MRRAEGVVDITVLSVDEAVYEGRIARLLARIKAEVVEEIDAGDQLLQHGSHRGHVEPRVPASFGSTQVGARGHLRSVVDEPGQRRQGGPDAKVICDVAVEDRHIEVASDQDPPAGYVRKIFEDGKSHSARLIFAG
jgi:hypothetical protein